jgi:N-acetylneuraminic acid mutarotase
VISPASGTYPFGQSVTIEDSSPGATIYYTTDGSIPNANSAVYTTALTLRESATVSAVAVAPDYAGSPLASSSYTITPATSQLNEWTWMGGSIAPLPSCLGFGLCGPPGVYGNIGVASPANIPGGRFEPARWSDLSGNIWIFGGGGFDAYGISGSLNDLWKLDLSSNLWTWMGGSGAVPCYTNSCDSSGGYSGVYGTLGVAAPGNIPGGRSAPATWTDKVGDLWLFGGYGYDSAGGVGPLNDLWMYNPGTNLWGWMGGSSSILPTNGVQSQGEAGVYGTKGTPAPGNIPGGRYRASTWVDNGGNFWLFGGEGMDAYYQDGQLNDVWMFNPSTSEWAWMGGSNTNGACDGTVGSCGQPGVYGTLGTPAAGNIPGGRSEAVEWTDSSGNLWLFGGSGYDSADTAGGLNDLWKFNPTSNQWAWMGGTSVISCVDHSAGTGLFGGYFCGQLATYGTLGVPAAGNTPGGTSFASSWVDSSGNFWLFGGVGLDTSGSFIGRVNVLWRFNPLTNQWAWMGGHTETDDCIELLYSDVVCGGPLGDYGTLQSSAPGNIPGSRDGAMSWSDRSGNLWLFSGSEDAADDTTEDQNDIWVYQPSAASLPPAVTPMFDIDSGTYSSGGSLTISNGMSNASFFYTVDGTTPTPGSTPYTGSITVVSSETVKAIATAPGYPNSGIASATYVIDAAVPTFSLSGGTYTTAQTVAINDTTPAAKIYYTTDGTTPTESSSQYSGAISVSVTETIQAIASAAGYADSDVASASYTIEAPAATPSFNVPGGTYTSVQSVSITDATPNSTVYYTTDGSTPTTGSTVYNGAITVASSETIKSIATATGYSTSTVASATYTINLPESFAVSALPASLTLNSGEQGAITITVTPQNGFNSAVSFACSGLPVGASCSFSPATVTPAGAAATSALTISVGAQASDRRTSRNPLLPVAALAMMIWVYGRRRRKMREWIVVGIVAAGLGFVSGCGGSGGGGGGGGTTGTPITSTVTVTATSGSLKQSVQISLTVD